MNVGIFFYVVVVVVVELVTFIICNYNLINIIVANTIQLLEIYMIKII